MEPDLDPANFVLDSKKYFFFLQSFPVYFFLKVHLHHFSNINVRKKSQNSRNQGFSYYFCLMIKGFRSVSVPLTYVSAFRRPKNIRIRIHNTMFRTGNVYRLHFCLFPCYCITFFFLTREHVVLCFM
jgi:hypothetical protein